jgi:hypothetical protein
MFFYYGLLSKSRSSIVKSSTSLSAEFIAAMGSIRFFENFPELFVGLILFSPEFREFVRA